MRMIKVCYGVVLKIKGDNICKTVPGTLLEVRQSLYVSVHKTQSINTILKASLTEHLLELSLVYMSYCLKKAYIIRL